jgi:anti-sigma factor RsiW
MRCRSAQSLLSRYLDRELRGWQRRRLDRHLGACALCQAELEADRRVWGLLEAREVAGAPDVMGWLGAQLDREPSSMSTRQPAWRFVRLAYAAAVLLFAAAGSLGGVYVAERGKPANRGAVDSEYAEFLGEAPAGLAPVASILQPMRTR